ncbi:MAG: hypothetical protein HY858_16645 [Candidatus Solibacter usitatus]|nr:hypothetical protein [Candidatus Solibacter usitatus]
MPVTRPRSDGFVVCIDHGGYPAALEVRKLYPVLRDTEAATQGLIRVVDESGEDYLYPARLFKRLTLPAELRRVLQIAS